MTKRAKWLVATWVAIFVVIQFFGAARINPPVTAANSIQSWMQIPPQVANILNHACMDCHSDETRWPWYSAIAPARWLVADDVNRGREVFNFSRWGEYRPWLRQAILGAMSAQVRQGSMPPNSYKALHREARLSQEEIKTLGDWAQSETKAPTNASKP